MAMKIYYGGEDDVTKCIAKKLAIEWIRERNVKDVELADLRLRASGRKVLGELNKLVKLGEKTPVIFVFDADDDCPVELLNEYCKENPKDSFCAINIAVDEAEAWLLADRKGLSGFLGIRQSDIPEEVYKDGEILTGYKTSLFIMKELVPVSGKKIIRDNLTMTKNAKKPASYNNLWPEFIYSKWDIRTAAEKSNNLRRAMQRVNSQLDRYASAAGAQ